jgi:hypothetical protein
MNKIECRLRNGVTLYDLPVGAIFADGGELFIKIDANTIYSNLDMKYLCDEAENGGCAAIIDRSSVPSAICLSDGLAVYFDQHKIVDMAFNNATLTIE